MLNKLKRIIPRHEGKMEDGTAAFTKFIPLLIAIITIGVMTLQFTCYMKEISLKDDVSITMRKYLIRMETYGYLTDDDKTLLLKDLTDMGMTEIDLSGTTVSEVEYGDYITIHVKGKLNLNMFSMTNITSGDWNNTVIDVNEEYSSTSQQG